MAELEYDCMVKGCDSPPLPGGEYCWVHKPEGYLHRRAWRFLKLSSKSRTMRISTLIAVLGALEASQGYLRTLLPPEAFGYMMIVLALVMAYLRAVTTNSIKDKQE